MRNWRHHDDDPDWWGYWQDHEDKNVETGDDEQVWAKALERWARTIMYVLIGLAVTIVCCVCGGWLIA